MTLLKSLVLLEFYIHPELLQRRLASSRLIKRVILFPRQFLFFNFLSITITPICLGASLRWHDKGKGMNAQLLDLYSDYLICQNQCLYQALNQEIPMAYFQHQFQGGL
jgi:hypothetical protein